MGNIKGYLFLKEAGLSVGIENPLVARKFSEIEKWINSHKKPDLFIRGFDDRTKITDSPYVNRGSEAFFLNSIDVEEAFKKIKLELDNKGVPLGNRLFLIGRAIREDNSNFCGQAYYSDNIILIDIKLGGRPRGQDWKPDLSFSIKINNKSPDLSDVDEKWKKIISRICLDIMKLYNKTCLEFAELKTGEFFYHDLYIH
jgi:hypothetical protein